MLSKQELVTKTGYNELVMPFGKYKGKDISDIVDINYLKWVLAEVKLRPEFREKIEKRISESELPLNK